MKYVGLKIALCAKKKRNAGSIFALAPMGENEFSSPPVISVGLSKILKPLFGCFWQVGRSPS